VGGSGDSRDIGGRYREPAPHRRSVPRDIVTGVGGKQVVRDDPEGNPNGPFEPAR
jgi:hypothetical protein